MKDAVDLVADLFDRKGTAAIPHFCGRKLKDIEEVWTLLFGDGACLTANALPDELADAVAACKYKDELPPIVSIVIRKPVMYKIVRRTS